MRKKSRVRITLGIVWFVSLVARMQAQPPTMINYQGRVSVDGVHFDGTGQFKFALVDGGTDGSITASAAATVAGGFLVTIDVLDGGAGYTEPPAITIDDATGTGATATAQIEGGRVTAITVINPGSGYSVAATVTIAAPPPDIAYVSYWSHDESSIDGGEPGTAIDLAVTRGLYAVPLGDGSLPNMTAPITPAALANPDVRLRVWFDDGEHGFRQLVPDQRVTSVGYALMAANVHGLQEALDEKSDTAHTHSADDITSGVLDAARIPDLDAAKITAGTLADARIPDLNAARITAGTFDAARIPNLPADRIASGVLDAARIPGLDAAQITSGTLNEARIPNAFWRLDGNPDTTPDTHFLGTTDNQALELRANNLRALRIEPDAESPRIVAGHASNVVSGAGATVSGGGSADFPNRSTNNYATVGGGARNTASEWFATVGGGWGNIASGTRSTVAGGEDNIASDWHATVGGGVGNRANGRQSTVAGGWYNIASGTRSTVAGGQGSIASGWHATVGGGGGNTASELFATVGGGWGNRANGSRSTVAGGEHNIASAWHATVGGGGGNIASGDYATIPGGFDNTATNYAFAAGRRAKAIHQGAFVWADSTDADFASTVNNEVVFRCNGGVRFTSGSGGDNQTVAWAPGAGSWTFSSDRELKEGFDPVDPQTVLGKVATLPISEWNYKGYEQRHIGPMAQDFYAAFPLTGASPATINSLHLDGVALAAIQGLNQKVTALQEENERLASELEAIKKHLGL